ncbi:MAG: DNA-directed RNA polymerase subunit K [Candidatus Thorarchaeota archaeon]
MSEKAPERKQIIADHIVIGPPKLTRFEKARIVGARGLQISLGAPILIRTKKEHTDPIVIAEEELEKNALPLTIARLLPDGKYQNIPLTWLLKGVK